MLLEAAGDPELANAPDNGVLLEAADDLKLVNAPVDAAAAVLMPDSPQFCFPVESEPDGRWQVAKSEAAAATSPKPGPLPRRRCSGRARQRRRSSPSAS